jgi:hypothetical protein
LLRFQKLRRYRAVNTVATRTNSRRTAFEFLTGW